MQMLNHEKSYCFVEIEFNTYNQKSKKMCDFIQFSIVQYHSPNDKKFSSELQKSFIILYEVNILLVLELKILLYTTQIFKKTNFYGLS